jgi:hypothetical protein
MHNESGKYVTNLADKVHYMYDHFLQLHLSNLNGMEPRNALYDSINSDDFVEIKTALQVGKEEK